MNDDHTSLNTAANSPPVSNIVPFAEWLREMNIHRVTGWNYRNRGWIKTLNLAGRIYVSREEIARFEERSEAGEFAVSKKMPLPPRSTNKQRQIQKRGFAGLFRRKR